MRTLMLEKHCVNERNPKYSINADWVQTEIVELLRYMRCCNTVQPGHSVTINHEMEGRSHCAHQHAQLLCIMGFLFFMVGSSRGSAFLVENVSTAPVCYANSLQSLCASFEIETRFGVAIIADLTRGRDLLLPSGYSVDLVDCDCLTTAGW